MKDITNPGSSKEEPKKKKSGIESALGKLNSNSCEDKDKSANPDQSNFVLTNLTDSERFLYLKKTKTDKKPIIKLWNDPSHTEPNQPHYALNEDLHRPNKKISIAEILAA